MFDKIYKKQLNRRKAVVFCAILLLVCTLLTPISQVLRPSFKVMSSPFIKSDSVTVMIYMCASDLESDDGSATYDILEMLSADIPSNINVVIQTGGTQKWHEFSISSKHSQRYLVYENNLMLVDNTLPQLDMTSPDTLRDFISFCSKNYPARRSILLFWGHGSGAVEGYGYDEFQDYSSSLTIDEIRGAILSTGAYFDLIGFDTCLMSGLETAFALRGCASYMLASEDYESGYGWDYRRWLEMLGKNYDIGTEALSRVIAEDFIAESQKSNTDAILALTDLGAAEALFEAWKDFAYTAPRASLVPHVTHATSADRYPLGDTMASCGIVDLLDTAKKQNTRQAKVLEEKVNSAVIFRTASADNADMCGLSVTLPYLSYDYFSRMKNIYLNIGIDSEYVSWLEGFTPHHIKSAA